jgi:hypothetical protein
MVNCMYNKCSMQTTEPKTFKEHKAETLFGKKKHKAETLFEKKPHKAE